MFTDRFNKFFSELMDNEGWISDDKFDKGGKTIAGISERSFPLQHKALTKMIDDERPHTEIMNYIKTFYYMNFYNQLYDSIIDSSLAFKIFDFGVNAGVPRAIKILQRTANMYNTPLEVDGIFGAGTLSVLNKISIPKSELLETSFYMVYVSRLKQYYKSLWNFFRFGKGWLNRLNRVMNKAPNLVAHNEVR